MGQGAPCTCPCPGRTTTLTFCPVQLLTTLKHALSMMTSLASKPKFMCECNPCPCSEVQKSFFSTYHCHHKYYRPTKILSELFPEILDRIITREYFKWMNLPSFRAHYRKHLAVHRSDDTRTELPWTKFCKELPDGNSPIINSAVIFDRNIIWENSHWINLVMISVTIVSGELVMERLSQDLLSKVTRVDRPKETLRDVSFPKARFHYCSTRCAESAQRERLIGGA